VRWRYRVAVVSALLTVYLCVLSAQQWGTKDNWLSAIVEAIAAGAFLTLFVVLLRSRRTRRPGSHR
jgi:uncharacterized membrane protein YeiB